VLLLEAVRAAVLLLLWHFCSVCTALLLLVLQDSTSH
jgi:hypothetical protein